MTKLKQIEECQKTINKIYKDCEFVSFQLARLNAELTKTLKKLKEVESDD